MNAYHIKEQDAYLRYHDLPGVEPACVFLHGLGSASSSAFPRIARDPRLCRHRAVLIDFLGYGYSDRPERFDYTMDEQAQIVASLLRHIGLCGCVLVGHSMGGSIAILVTAADPGLVSSLVVAEGNLDPGPGFVSGIITAVDEPTFTATGHAEFVRRVRRAGYSDFAGTAAIADPVALHRSAASLIAVRRPTYRDLLIALTVPKTYVFGEQTLPDPDVEHLREAGIHVRVVPASGHDMMFDNPGGFAEVVSDAIAARA
jgi:pimeloyl-ACP methyl ester carboxylesterase